MKKEAVKLTKKVGHANFECLELWNLANDFIMNKVTAYFREEGILEEGEGISDTCFIVFTSST